MRQRENLAVSSDDDIGLSTESRLWLETFLPDGLDTIAEVVEDMAALDTTASREEAANDSGDVLSDVERLGIIHTDALHTEIETSDARKYHRLTFPQFLFQNIL